MIDLQVHQQFGRIGLQISPYEFNLKIKPADFEVKQYPAQIEVEQPAAVLDIDYTAFRESLGYRNIEAQAEYFRQDSQQTCAQGIMRRAQQGEELSDLSKKISIAQIAEQSTQPKERNLQLVRLEPVKISVTTKDLQWRVDAGGVDIEFTPPDIQAEFRQGDVKVYIRNNFV